MPQSPDARAVLLIQTAFIGDVILATALLERLHDSEPDTPVDVLVRRGNEGLLKGHPYVRQVLVWDKKQDKYGGLWRLLKQIRVTGYDRVINMQRFASTGLLTAFSGAREKVGFDKNPLSWLFTRTLPHGFAVGLHEVSRNLSLVEPGIPGPFTRPRLYPSAADEASTAAYRPATPYICIAPTSVWYTKQYPLEKWADLLRALPSAYTVFLIGAPSDVDACAQLAEQAGRPNVVNLAGKLSLLASAALMRDAVLNYVNDSAPMHLASATDAPTCAVYCSTVPYFGFGPLSSFARVVERPGELACRPCGLHGYAKCPLGHFRCALDIQTQQLLAVLAEAEQRAVALV